uniref:Uncharacterized protein n=1 Tax=viral metagenome TaxID=1070528 RepID=A0A6C0JN68_9ZZZZ
MGDSIKIILDGLPTGKSSFIRNLRGEPFNPMYEPTEGGGAVPYLLENEENKKKLSIILYDTPGQSTINREWEDEIYNDTDCAIFFFQKSNTPSFKYVKKQLKKYKRMKKREHKEAICVLYATQTNERSKIPEEEIMRLTRPNVKYMEGSNKINGSAKNVLLATLKSLYETLRPKDRSPQLDEELFDIFSEKALRDLVGLYDQNSDYPYWNKLKAFFTSFHFRTKQSRRKKSVKKQSRRKRSIKKQSRRKRSIKKQSRRKKSIKKQSRRKKSIKKIEKKGD